MKPMKSALIATASLGALCTVLAIGPAAATPIYDINPNAIPGVSGYGTSVAITNGILGSDSTIVQTTATSQTDTGIAYITNFQNNGNPVIGSGLGLVESGTPDSYGLYLSYTAVVNGISGFSPGSSGTIAPNGFSFSLIADVGDNDVYTPGTDGAAYTNPIVSSGGGNDVVLAVGTSLSGSAGFQASTGAPTFATVSNFVICDGNTNEGVLGGKVVTATGCGLTNALNYFVAPSPFYNLNISGFTSSDTNDLTVYNSGSPTGSNATLNGIGGSASFAQVPEPLTLSLFGAGLLGMGGLKRFRSKKA